MKTIDWAVVGAQKSGTTTLFQLLRQSPTVYIPSEKEVPLFGKESTGSVDSYYQRHFRGADPSALWGTVTPQYMQDGAVPRLLREHSPWLRMVAILRDPVERAYSQYRMEARRRSPEMPPLAFRQRIQADLTACQYDPSLFEGDHSDNVVANSSYGRILARFMEQFDAQQLLILTLEELQLRPHDVVNRILGHIGATSIDCLRRPDRRAHVGGDHERVSNLRERAASIAPLRWLWRRAPARLRRRANVAYLYWNIRAASPERSAQDQLPHTLRESLSAWFIDDLTMAESLGLAIPRSWVTVA